MGNRPEGHSYAMTEVRIQTLAFSTIDTHALVGVLGNVTI